MVLLGQQHRVRRARLPRLDRHRARPGTAPSSTSVARASPRSSGPTASATSPPGGSCCRATCSLPTPCGPRTWSDLDNAIAHYSRGFQILSDESVGSHGSAAIAREFERFRTLFDQAPSGDAAELVHPFERRLERRGLAGTVHVVVGASRGTLLAPEGSHTMRSPRGVPRALSSSDVPGGHRLLVHSCEDCACPVSHVESDPSHTVVPSGPLIRARDVLDHPPRRRSPRPVRTARQRRRRRRQRGYPRPARRSHRAHLPVRAGGRRSRPGARARGAHPAARRRSRARGRGRARAAVPEEPRADRLAARHERLQPRLPLLLRAQVARCDGRGDGRGDRRRARALGRRARLQLAAAQVRGWRGQPQPGGAVRAARPRRRPVRRSRARVVRCAAQQRGRDLRPARARARRARDRRHGVAGRHRRGSRRPAPDRGWPTVLRHGRTVDRPAARSRRRPTPLDHDHRPERRRCRPGRPVRPRASSSPSVSTSSGTTLARSQWPTSGTRRKA